MRVRYHSEWGLVNIFSTFLLDNGFRAWYPTAPMSSRSKGQRTERKAIAYLATVPNTAHIHLYQTSRFASPQPFDLLVLRDRYWPRFVEVRSNQWRTGRASTKTLAALPGEGFHKQVWLFRDGWLRPEVRQWNGREWAYRASPWEEAESEGLPVPDDE